jgi:hypothetical protein
LIAGALQFHTQRLIIKRFEAQRPHLEAIASAAEEIKTLNYRQFENPRLTELVDLIYNEASALKE